MDVDIHWWLNHQRISLWIQTMDSPLFADRYPNALTHSGYMFNQTQGLNLIKSLNKNWMIFIWIYIYIFMSYSFALWPD